MEPIFNRHCVALSTGGSKQSADISTLEWCGVAFNTETRNMAKLLRLKLVGAFSAGAVGAGLSASLIKLNLERAEKENYLMDIRKSLEEVKGALAKNTERLALAVETRKPREDKENSKTDEIPEQKPLVCVINMQGQISSAGPISMQVFREVIDEAFQHENLQEVILNIHSGGGSLIQADLITTYIKEKSVKHNVPVISFVEDFATSCGYWLACAGTEIYACRNSSGKSSLRFHQSLLPP